MGNFPIQYDPYLINSYYFQFRVEADLEVAQEVMPNATFPTAQITTDGVKISIGFCRDNLDLNKNLIMMNKKKEYWILDLFDGELYSHNNQIGDSYP